MLFQMESKIFLDLEWLYLLQDTDDYSYIYSLNHIEPHTYWDAQILFSLNTTVCEWVSIEQVADTHVSLFFSWYAHVAFSHLVTNYKP